jgi:hypothetical protein
MSLLESRSISIEQKALGDFRGGSVTPLGLRQILPEGDRLFAKGSLVLIA